MDKEQIIFWFEIYEARHEILTEVSSKSLFFFPLMVKSLRKIKGTTRRAWRSRVP